MTADLEVAPGVVATPEGALWLPEAGVLAVADLHVGYEAVQVRRGSDVPPVEAETLAGALASATARLRPDVVVVAGDVQHAPAALRVRGLALAVRRGIEEALAAAGGAEVVLVAGNHDVGLDRLLPDVRLVAEHVVAEAAGGADVRFAHGHEPVARRPGEWLVVGHEHPRVSLAGGGPPLRAPALLADADARAVVLPAQSPWAAGVVPGRHFAGAALRGADPNAFRAVVLAEGETWDFGPLRGLRRKFR